MPTSPLVGVADADVHGGVGDQADAGAGEGDRVDDADQTGPGLHRHVHLDAGVGALVDLDRPVEVRHGLADDVGRHDLDVARAASRPSCSCRRRSSASALAARASSPSSSAMRFAQALHLGTVVVAEDGVADGPHGAEDAADPVSDEARSGRCPAGRRRGSVIEMTTSTASVKRDWPGPRDNTTRNRYRRFDEKRTPLSASNSSSD